MPGHGLFGIVLLAVMLAATPSSADPKPITWEWFHAAETYLHYPKQSRNDLLLAAHFFRLAASNGNASAAYKLAEMYENGVGVGKNYATAFHWYQVSAELGDPYAEYRVGWFYHQGLGTQPDIARAVHWYALASKQGNQWAQQSLGFLYADGNGVEKDREQARHYFELSLPRTNDHWAKLKLATLILDSEPVQARKLLRESAAASNPEAQKLLHSKGW